MQRRVVVVDGPVAFHMRRLEAAQQRDIGLQILPIPQLAARLAGGFLRLADRDTLHLAIAEALESGGLQELKDVARLPGMVRAVEQTLGRVWRANFDLDAHIDESPRFDDLALIQRRVRAALPKGLLIPPDLCCAALGRVHHAKTLFGSIVIDRLIHIDAVWQPLFSKLIEQLSVTWRTTAKAGAEWFAGELLLEPEITPVALTGEVCADPRAEVVESMRWARSLLARGSVSAAEVALTAVEPTAWDDHVLVLARSAGLPIYFSHGIPALSTREGQTCAALADILISGLSQDRVRRLINHLFFPSVVNIPNDWSKGLPRQAGLFELEHWLRALSSTRDQRASGELAEQVLLPVLALLAKGASVAGEAGERVLRGSALGLWQSALRAAPPAAIALSLQGLRVHDDRDPANSVVWGPASHLAGAPRRFMRLLGLSARQWPRAESEDPLLPNHLVQRRELDPLSVTQLDRAVFEAMVKHCEGEIVLSRSRRSAEGSLKSPSSLWPRGLDPLILSRTRVPTHAFSEGDRLLARPEEAARSIQVVTSRQCWRNWSRADATAHDGAIRALHPAIERALTSVHSTTSLRRLLRDPLGFVWRYALGWRSVELAQRPLALNALVFGELVHELMRRTVDGLEPTPGFTRASQDEIELALRGAVDHVTQSWPLERAVPPLMLWRHTLEDASRRCLWGLTVDKTFVVGTRSWTELGFGLGPSEQAGPWDPSADVVVPETGLRLSGRIDRVDVNATGTAVRITDYKTGVAPRRNDFIVLRQGAEVQRVLYAVAARHLLPDVSAVVSRLAYLDGESEPLVLQGEALDTAIAEITRYLNVACEQLRNGGACPGADTDEQFYDLRLALPAELDAYLQRKRSAFERMNHGLKPLWSHP